MSDFTVVIPHRGNTLGLWATVHSCEVDLIGSPFDYNYVIVSNGEKLSADSASVLEQLGKTSKLLKHVHTDEPMTPPQARQVGARCADGEFLFFFDNHCLVDRQYFARAIADFHKWEDIGLLHSSTVFHSGDGAHYHYRLALEKNFWGEPGGIPPVDHKPYLCAAGGHGGIVIRRRLWEEVGGYGPDSLFRGYGGEEMSFDLRLWRWGYTVYQDPKLVHYHFASGQRGYSKHYSDDYYTNLLVSAFVIGGEPWLYKVFKSFVTGVHIRFRPEREWYDILLEAYDRGKEYAQEVERRSTQSLDELLHWFRLNLVAM